MLTPELLEELRARWAAQAPAFVERLRPGLAGAELDAAAAAAGMTLPTEARTWWGWRDGVAASSIRTSHERAFGPGLQFLPLAEAVSLHARMKRLARDAAAGAGSRPPHDDPEFWWRPDWFPVLISTLGTVVAVDCSVGPDQPTHIRAVDYRSKPDFDAVEARSFGDMVRMWIEALDSGRWRYLDAEQRWECSIAPPERWIV